MHRTLSFVVVILLGAVIGSAATVTVIASFKPKEGFVPTKEVAIKIAVAIWEPIYGAQLIGGEKPYRARLENGVWIVEGSLPKRFTRGGVAEARISKEDGRILKAIHGK
jgi:hypothetical protein